MVIDTTSGKQVGEIPDTQGVHGIALDHSTGRGYTSNGREDTVSVFDLKSLAVEKKIKVGNGPDAISTIRSRSASSPSTEKVMTQRPSMPRKAKS